MFEPPYFGQITSSTTVMIAIGVPAVGLSFVLALIAMVMSGRDRRRRLDLLEQALRSPNLPPDTARELVAALKPPPRRATFTLGWLGAFLGIGWLCTEPRGDEFTWAVIVTVASFAFLTLPLALREVEARKA